MVPWKWNSYIPKGICAMTLFPKLGQSLFTHLSNGSLLHLDHPWL